MALVSFSDILLTASGGSPDLNFIQISMLSASFLLQLFVSTSNDERVT